MTDDIATIVENNRIEFLKTKRPPAFFGALASRPVHRELHEVLAFTLGALGALAVIATFVIVVCSAHESFTDASERDRDACRAHGGEVERINCRMRLTPMSCGRGCAVFATSETCDWRCAE